MFSTHFPDSPHEPLDESSPTPPTVLHSTSPSLATASLSRLGSDFTPNMKHFPIFAALCAIPYVAAHGFVSKVTIDGKTYAGNEPGQYKGASCTLAMKVSKC